MARGRYRVSEFPPGRFPGARFQEARRCGGLQHGGPLAERCKSGPTQVLLGRAGDAGDASAALSGTASRNLMRTGLRGLLPEAVRTRRSKAPYDGVFLASLRPLAMRMLRGVRQMRLVQHGFVDPRSVENRLQKLVQHLECNEPQLRRVILLEYWLQNRERTGALRGSDGVTADEPLFHARLAMSAAFECR